MELNYKRCGDYLIPDVVCHNPHRSLGRYGRLRRSFLKQYNPIYYNELVLTEKLFDHCLEIEDVALSRMEQLLPGLAWDAGASAGLKMAVLMKWVGLMNACKNQAEEIIMSMITESHRNGPLSSR